LLKEDKRTESRTESNIKKVSKAESKWREKEQVSLAQFKSDPSLQFQIEEKEVIRVEAYYGDGSDDDGRKSGDKGGGGR
jgi:hypothetical protein